MGLVHTSGSVVHECHRRLVGENVTLVTGRQPVCESCPHRLNQLTGWSWQNIDTFPERDCYWQRKGELRWARSPRGASGTAKTRATDRPPGNGGR